MRIYEYPPTRVHAKTLVVDGRFALVGTINLDVHSLALNDEVTLEAVRDEPFFTRLRQRTAARATPFL